MPDPRTRRIAPARKPLARIEPARIDPARNPDAFLRFLRFFLVFLSNGHPDVFRVTSACFLSGPGGIFRKRVIIL